MVSRLFAALLPHLQAGGLADQLITAPADVTFAADTVLQPDLFVADMSGVLKSGQWTDLSTLFLVIEVLSPSTARADRTLKRPVYQSHGIPEYWIVDGEQRQVEVWTPDATEPVIVRDRLVWRHPALDDDCVIDLRRLFNFG
jgi:Uma2 family endonuclease